MPRSPRKSIPGNPASPARTKSRRPASRRPAPVLPRSQGSQAKGSQAKGPNSPRPNSQRSTSEGKTSHPEGERLHKVLASAGIASRRESEAIILEGRVEVDGQTMTELGTRVNRHQQNICVDGEPLPSPKLAYYAIHKPEGVVCTTKDPSGRPRLTDLLPTGLGRLFSVGRLDMSSEGLILVTNDGCLANELTHPRHGVEKTYEVQVAGHIDQTVLIKLRKGVHLAEGFARVVHVKVKSRRKNGTILEMVLDEGRNREVRRLLANVGHRVQRLTRTAIGPIRLGEMPAGAVRRLTAEELKKLRTYVSEAEKKPRGQQKQLDSPDSRQAVLSLRERKRQAAAGKRRVAAGGTRAAAGDTRSAAGKPSAAAGKPSAAAGKPSAAAGKPSAAAGKRSAKPNRKGDRR